MLSKALIRKNDFHTRGKVRFHIRKSSLVLVLLVAGVVFLGLMFVHASIQRRVDDPALNTMAAMVRGLELTDLCLFTEARYTRHLSQADLYSAFQDHPSSLEHFPTGSIAGPPVALRRVNGKLD
jgi:hypothetical protein